MKLLRNTLIAAAVVLTFAPPALQAQPALHFNRTANNWPTIELYLQAECHGQPTYALNIQNFTVRENGVEVNDFTLHCPDPSAQCPFSAALVFDASGSMAGTPNAAAKDAGYAFVNTMDGTTDEAAVLWFNQSVTLKQSLTTDKTALKSAIDDVSASGTSAIWDAIAAGLNEIADNGSNTCRAVIVVTDEMDNSSSHTIDEVIFLARKNRIRVYTIGLGGISYTPLETVALLTGGKYFQAPNPSQLVGIYEDIADIILGGFHECMITYQAECKDGTMRTIDLTLQNVCGPPVTMSKTYRAPKDTSTYSPITISLADAEGRSTREITVPIKLETPVSDFLHPAQFDVVYSPAHLQFDRIETPPGALLEGVSFTASPIIGGVRIEYDRRRLMNGSGMLAQLVFRAADVPDTSIKTMELADWQFQAGCFRPVLESGSVKIVPRSPEMNCTMNVPSSLDWKRSITDYAPNPFYVSAAVVNTGDLEVKAVKFRIDADPAGFQLLSPVTDTQPGFPSDVPVGEVSEAQWLVSAKTRTTGDSAEICITALMDNHENVTCCRKVWIPPTGPVLECSIDSVTIVADTENERYIPMPFDLNVRVRNRGGMNTEPVYATIYLPPGDLALAGGPGTATTVVSPENLLPNQTGVAQWQLKHPPSLTEKEYTVRIWTKTSNADSVLCETKVSIPRLKMPRLQAKCTAPDSLAFDESLGRYVPNPFAVTVEAANTAAMTAEDVTAFLYLPEGVELDPPGQPLRGYLGDLEDWQPGDTIPSHTWTVRYTRRLPNRVDLDFRFAVGGVSAVGQLPTDTVFSTCTVQVEGLPPLLGCTMRAPDTLRVNAAGYDVQPNPFTVSFAVYNKTNHAIRIEAVEAFLPGGGYRLDPNAPDNGKFRLVDRPLNPGDTAFYDWAIEAEPRLFARDAQFRAIATDEYANPLECSAGVYIEPVHVALNCGLAADTPVIAFDSAAQSYPDRTVTVTATLTNTSGVPQTDIRAELSVTDPDSYLEPDPAYPNTNPVMRSVLFGGGSLTAQWHYRLRKDDSTGAPETVEFSVDYGSNEVPSIQDACNALVQIEPVVVPAPVKPYTGDVTPPDSTLRFTGGGEPRASLYPRSGPEPQKPAPQRFSLSQNYPNPFSSRTDIVYTMARVAEVRITVHDILGREVAELVNGTRSAGQHTAKFNAQDLPGGVYILRMHAAGYVGTRVMHVKR